MTPTTGRIVHYRLREDQAEAINRRRHHAHINIEQHVKNANGVMVHVGNSVTAGQTFPMMIVAVWGDQPDSYVNGQVFLDGNDTFWATSVKVGEGPGTWSWPPKTGS